MKSKKAIVQGLAWVAWITFVISLFMPIEGHTLSLGVSRFCSGGSVYCGYQNAIYFLLSPLFLLLNLVQGIQAAIFYPEMLGTALYLVFGLLVHSIIGIGQVLMALAPLWSIRIKKPFRQKLHFWLLLFGTLAVIAYGLFPDIRQGVELRGGYYVWAVAFLLHLGASAWMLFSKEPNAENQLVASDVSS